MACCCRSWEFKQVTVFVRTLPCLPLDYYPQATEFTVAALHDRFMQPGHLHCRPSMAHPEHSSAVRLATPVAHVEGARSYKTSSSSTQLQCQQLPINDDPYLRLEGERLTWDMHDGICMMGSTNIHAEIFIHVQILATVLYCRTLQGRYYMRYVIYVCAGRLGPAVSSYRPYVMLTIYRY